MTETAQLDHAVINVRYDMDRATPLFASLGFTLTPRGYHTLGSINHLMMFATDYLELLGLPPGGDAARLEIAEAPLGLNGLVFKSADVDATYDHLQAVAMAGNPPQAFSRPVELSDGARDARFRTVAVRPGVFPAGRVYFCEHGTPELVWRAEWQAHTNLARGIPEFVIATATPEREAERYLQLIAAKATGGGDEAVIEIDRSRLTLLSPARYADRFGRLASAMDGRQSIFGAIVLATGNVGAIADLAGKLPGSLPAVVEPDRVAIRLPEVESVLEFVG